MRTAGTFKPRFWSSGSGRKLRGNSDAQVLAIYFMFSPHSTMIGLYYEPLISILHETGLSLEKYRAAYVAVSEVDIARYDEEAGLVYLPSGAMHNIGETLSVKDKKRPAILGQLRVYGKHPFVKEWVTRYYEPYQLSHDGIADPNRPVNGDLHDAPSMPLHPLHAPSMGHARPVHAPDPRSGSDPRSDPRENGESGEEPPLVADLHTRARLWVKDPHGASLRYPKPEQWSEMTELNDLVASTFGVEPDTLTGIGKSGSLDGRVQVVLERWAEGTEQARLREAVRGASHSDLIRSKPELQSLMTILKDSNAVDKYVRLARSKEPKVNKSNRETLTPDAAEARRSRRDRAGEF